MANIKDLKETVPYSPGVMDERTTSILDTALFQYIARQLWEIKKFWASTIEEGEMETEDVELDGTRTVQLPVNWFSVTIANDGPDTAYMRLNRPTAKEATLNSADELNLSFRTRVIQTLYFRCDSGDSASLRLIGLY